jgi:hypothetical protein
VNAEEVLDELKRVAEKLGVKVRAELMPALGGLCTLKGEKVLLVNSGLEPWDQADVMARGLAQLSIDGVYMAPQVREMIERHKSKE